MNLNRITGCMYTINDMVNAINMELLRDKPYSGYILEKAKHILNDIQVIIEECKEDK